ncbi:MAG: hypothetical protein ACFFCS_26575 [Candidatus Hodarchaeota archaeon]
MYEKITAKSLEILKKVYDAICKMNRSFMELQELEHEIKELLKPGELREPILGKKIRVPPGIRYPGEGSRYGVTLFTCHERYVVKRKKWIKRMLGKHFKNAHDPIEFFKYDHHA